MPMSDRSIEYAAKVAAFSALRGRILSENKVVLFDALDASGIAKAVVRFEGQGWVDPWKSCLTPCPGQTQTWSAGDGAYGDLTFNVDSRSFRLRYNRRVMASVRLTRWF
jgi:hypothetical protein